MPYVPGFEPYRPDEADQSKYVPGFEPYTPPAAEAQAAPAEETWIKKNYRDYVAEPLTKAVASAPRYMMGELDVRDPRAGEIREQPIMSESVARMVVPQTPTSAGALLGTLAGGPFGALARILGATAGAAGGSAAEGNEMSQVSKDAALSGAGAVAGEGVSALGSKIIRSLPWMKGVIAEGDAAKYGAQMGEQSPPLAGAKTAAELRAMASGPGRDALGQAKEQATQAIEGIVGTGPVLPMPSLGGTGMSLRDANDALSTIGARAFGKNPLERTFNGIDQRRLYGEVARDIEAGLGALDPAARDIFAAAQGVHARGMTLLKPLEKERAFRMDSGGPQFNTPEIQKFIGTPKGEAMLRNKLGDQGFEELRDAMLRGGEPGSKDVLAAGAGGPFDALWDFLRHPTGFGGFATLIPRSVLPNVGSKYAGRAPFTAPDSMKALLDMIGSQGAVKIGPVP